MFITVAFETGSMILVNLVGVPAAAPGGGAHSKLVEATS
jgi:hypothetical protein